MCLRLLGNWYPNPVWQYHDVIMNMVASQITSLAIVYSSVYSDADQRKHQSSASLAFVWGIHRGPVIFPHKWPVTRKMFPFDDVIMRVKFVWKIVNSSAFHCSTTFHIPQVVLWSAHFLSNIFSTKSLSTPRKNKIHELAMLLSTSRHRPSQSPHNVVLITDLGFYVIDSSFAWNPKWKLCSARTKHQHPIWWSFFHRIHYRSMRFDLYTEYCYRTVLVSIKMSIVWLFITFLFRGLHNAQIRHTTSYHIRKYICSCAACCSLGHSSWCVHFESLSKSQCNFRQRFRSDRWDSS